MKTLTLPPLTRGLDVTSPEGSLPEGSARRATNVQLLNDGGFQQRPGYGLLVDLANAHSLWEAPAQTRVLVAAGDTLYDVDLANAAVGALFTGLPPGVPVSYDEVGPDIFFTAGEVLRRVDPAGNVTRPGVCDLLGSAPALTSTVGTLAPGRYGCAYSLVTTTGEESPISSTTYLEIDGGGILASDLQLAADVDRVRLYLTDPNGEDLRLHSTVAYASSVSLTTPAGGKLAERMGLRAMPGGSIVRHRNGRLAVVRGKALILSQPYDVGVSDARGGWWTLDRTITMCEPVRDGFFVGMRERTVFLRGTGSSYEQINVGRGALAQSVRGRAKADFFSPELVPDRRAEVAVWLSDVGLAIGMPDGSVAYPQAGQMSITGGNCSPLFAEQGGIKQGVFCVESMVTGTGGATDLTL